jgi:hypothetical protein
MQGLYFSGGGLHRSDVSPLATLRSTVVLLWGKMRRALIPIYTQKLDTHNFQLLPVVIKFRKFLLSHL